MSEMRHQPKVPDVPSRRPGEGTGLAKRPSAPPASPQELLQARPSVSEVRRRPNLFFWAIALLIAAQLFLPADKKPARLAGHAAADFYGRLMDEANRKELELAEQQAIARKIAELQADYSAWKGRCMLVMVFDHRYGTTCMQGADAFYQNALHQIEKSRRYGKPSQ